MLGVQPVAHEGLARGRLALRNLVLVMGEDKIDASGMDVKSLAQEFHGHRGALDVPAGSPGAQRRLPKGLAFLGRLPERKVAGVVLVVLIRIDPCPVADARKVDLGQLAIVLECSYPE